MSAFACLPWKAIGRQDQRESGEVARKLAQPDLGVAWAAPATSRRQTIPKQADATVRGGIVVYAHLREGR